MMFGNLKDKNRWRNPAMYTSLLSALFLVLKLFGIEILPEMQVHVENAVNAILGLLVFAGILINPDEEPVKKQ
jgi:uncharacterized membrane protein